MAGPMNVSPAEVSANLLVAKSFSPALSGLADWGVRINGQFDQPDRMIIVNDTTGRMDGHRDMINGRQQMHDGVQFMVRDPNEKTGAAKAKALEILLNENVQNFIVAVGTDTYQVFCYNQTSPIMNIGREVGKSKRMIWTLNYVMVVTMLPNLG